MKFSAHFSCIAPVFNGIQTPEQGTIVGYGAIIHALQLQIPYPETISLVSSKNKKYRQENWIVFPASYLPDDSLQMTEMEALYKQLVFALKYEGVNLLLFKKLSQHYNVDQLNELVNIEPTGLHSRRIWFLIEWLANIRLDREDLTKKSYVKLLDESMQFSIEGIKSSRHLVLNNLPGTKDFCPLVFKTPKLEKYIELDLSNQQNAYLQGIRKDILQRASAFLLLKDSKASFSIEGESPKSKRASRWAQAIGQAGSRSLSKEELLRLQQLVIENPRFLEMGYRKKGGFVGEHDRITGEPIPDHISAKWQDLETLMNGLLTTGKLLSTQKIDAVVAAACVAFGFVFIHPFEDGNGRIHRYLIHHILAVKKFTRQGFIFPVSAAILDKINDYRKTLESYSLPLLDFINWKEGKDHNVEVMNETIDYYRYFNATRQAEFLYDAVFETINYIIPKEVKYLSQFESFKTVMEEEYEMPDKMIALLVRFLESNHGKLSKRTLHKEFANLTSDESKKIEDLYKEIFISD